jgi:glyoxylase-like metal-dependent hydrolase (beta-lactamase superfamily II)
VITFEHDMTFHLGDETIHALHVERAHTDGDVIVRFEKANVIHMGDTFFNGMYPIIDVESGGTLDGMIAATERGLSMIDVATKVVPGHGPMGTRADLEAYHAMLVGIRDAVKPLLAQGKSLADVRAAKPTAAFDAKWGGGFVKPDRFVEMIYSAYSQPETATAGAH